MDQIILIIFGVVILMSILGKLIKPVLWLIISIYLINKFTIYFFDVFSSVNLKDHREVLL